MFDVGIIVNTHGIRGEVKVHRISDFEERFATGEKLYAVKNNEPAKELIIEGHRRHKGFDLLLFKDYQSIEDVEPLKDAYLKIDETQLTELDEGEYYYHEIIGCHVYTTANELLGEVKEILAPGANDVFSVRQENGEEVLIPNIKDVVKIIDVDKKEIVIELMEGLLD